MSDATPTRESLPDSIITEAPSTTSNNTFTTQNHDLPSTSSASSSKTPSTGTPSPSLERKIKDALKQNSLLNDSTSSTESDKNLMDKELKVTIT